MVEGRWTLHGRPKNEIRSARENEAAATQGQPPPLTPEKPSRLEDGSGSLSDLRRPCSHGSSPELSDQMTRVTSDLVLSTSDRNGFVSMACTIGRQFGQVEENPVNPARWGGSRDWGTVWSRRDGVDPETEAMREEICPVWTRRDGVDPETEAMREEICPVWIVASGPEI